MSTKTLLSWVPEQTHKELHELLLTLGEEYPLVAQAPLPRRAVPAKGGMCVAFVPGGPKAGLEVSIAGHSATIRYDKSCHAARGVGALLAGLVKPGQVYREQSPFETFGIMLDCSRNAVMTVEHFCAWLRRLVLMGYNMAMLYTEDTYELPSEGMFGYLRGRYSQEELRCIDAYAARLGVEMIGCIQTLGHLEQILKWPAYSHVRDTGGVLLVDEPKTYELIEKMIANFARCYRSRRLHIGMDETYGLGRGRFMDLFGHQRAYDIFNRHLGKVAEICRRHGLSPMMWSDMFFSLGGARIGYDPDCRIPDAIKQAIPKNVQMVFWDYYHDNEEFYLDWIARHRELGFEPILGGGTWTWSCLWYDRFITEATTAPCVRACRKSNLKEFFFTLWGDDGGYCEYDSALAGLAYGAEIAYAGQANPAVLEKRFGAICGASYRMTLAGTGLQTQPQPEGKLNMKRDGAPTLWDDPLLGIFYKARTLDDKGYWARTLRHYRKLANTLRPARSRVEPIDFAYAYLLASYLRDKVELAIDLEKAYALRRPAELKAMARRAGGMAKRLDAILAAFRRQWLRRNKPHGLETIQIRLGGQKQRFEEVRQRLLELAGGKIESIPELDEQPTHSGALWPWRSIASSSNIL